MSSLLDEDGFIIFETGDAGQGFDAEAASSKVLRPLWKVFSTTMPMPATVQPA